MSIEILDLYALEFMRTKAKDLEKNFQNSDIIKNGFSYNFTTGKKKSTSFQDELVKCRNNSDS